MRNAFADVIYELSITDPKICALVADLSPAGSMVRFRERFPERFINTGVAEQVMIGIAAGLAMRGMRPFCYTIATFSLYRPFEMVRVDLAYQKLPVTVIGMGAGLTYSTLGGTHQSMEDIAVASAVPNMTVLAPCDPSETRVLTQWCASKSDGPTYMRLGKAGEPDLTSDSLEPLIPGKIRYLRRGENIAVLSYGTSVAMALVVAKKLEQAGKSVSILSVHTLKPLDTIGVQQVLQNHEQVVVIEEHVPKGGLGSQVKESAWNISARCSVHCFSLKDEFIHFYGTHSELLEEHGLSANRIVEALLGPS
jgi:transketolase